MKAACYLAVAAMLVSCSQQSSQPTAPSATPSSNQAPIIDSVIVHGILFPGAAVDIECYARDPDGDSLSYHWRASEGDIIGSGWHVRYAPASCCSGSSVTVEVTVRDRWQASATEKITLPVY